MLELPRYEDQLPKYWIRNSFLKASNMNIFYLEKLTLKEEGSKDDLIPF